MAMNPLFTLGATATGIDPALAKQMADASTMEGTAAMLGAAGSLMQPPPAATSQSVYTPEMLQNALDAIRNYGRAQEGVYGTAVTAPGASVTQTSQVSPQEIKEREFIQFRIAQGDTPEQAAQKAAARAASGKGFGTDKFKRYVGKGNAQGLSIGGGGGIKAGTEFRAGGLEVDPQSEALRAALQGLGMQGMQGIGGMLSQGFDQDGLTPRQAGSLDDLKARYMDEFSDVYRDSTRAAMGELVATGTNRSSFAPQFIADTAGKTQSRFLTQALGELAGREEQMMQGRAARQSQALQNYRMGIMNPGQLGLFTDPQSAQFAANLQQQNIANRAQTQGMMNQALLQPISLMPDTGTSIGDRATGALSGAAVGAAAGSIIPGLGTAAGAGIGALGGMFR